MPGVQASNEAVPNLLRAQYCLAICDLMLPVVLYGQSLEKGLADVLVYDVNMAVRGTRPASPSRL
jgi:hypothetical protein